MIQAYPAEASIRPGETLTLHVSTDAPVFRVAFFRCGRRTPMGCSRWLPGERVPPHLPYQDWGQDGTGLEGEDLPGWPPYTFGVPGEWPSGVYVAVFEEGDRDGRALHPQSASDVSTPDGRTGRALFVVRSRTPGRASILYKLPLLTYHAYNQACQPYDPRTGRGGWSLYTVPRSDEVPVPVPPAVSLHRPGGGTGGTPSDLWNADPFDPTPRQTFVHWDAPFVRWLERNGYEVDYCTDLDVHRDTGPGLLGSYRLLLSVGHDEYWSDEMRANVEQFVRAGGNVAFFGGNTCWWRVAFDDPFTFRRLHTWSEQPVPGRPENALTGVSYRNGGERGLHDDTTTPVGYRVQHAGHWVYEGTGLDEGATFGDGDREHLVGYECDGAAFDRRDLAGGRPVRPTGDDGTPPDFLVLGVGDVAASGWGLGNKAATMGLYEHEGTVFTAATTDWARVLASGASPPVERTTRNVLDRLGA